MNFANIKDVIIPEGNVVEIKVGGVSIWKKHSTPSNLFNLEDRVASKSFAKTVTTTFASAGYTFNENEYVYPIRYDGRIYARTNTNVNSVVQGTNSLAFTTTANTFGIGFPFILDANKTYKISADESVGTTYRFRIINFDNTGIVTNSSTYGLNRSSLTFSGYDGWTLILFEVVSVGDVNFSNITLEEV